MWVEAVFMTDAKLIQAARPSALDPAQREGSEVLVMFAPART
jgi:hypothetical protein